MTDDVIVGICRFSFLGVGDWSSYKVDSNTSSQRQQKLEIFQQKQEKIAEYLYADNRMKARFATFEHICLPSILSQTDPRFIFIVLSSPRMPAHWRDRLIEICEPHSQIELVWSDIPDTGGALREPLTELYDIADGKLWQFRLDDDDAVDVNFISRLRRHIPRMKGINNCGISVARGMYVALYEGQETQFLEFEAPFHSAGATVKLSEPGLSIFKFGHAMIAQRITNFVDFEDFGALALRWNSDSTPLNLDRLPRRVERMAKLASEMKIRNHFPFMEGFDFDSLRPVTDTP